MITLGIEYWYYSYKEPQVTVTPGFGKTETVVEHLWVKELLCRDYIIVFLGTMMVQDQPLQSGTILDQYQPQQSLLLKNLGNNRYHL